MAAVRNSHARVARSAGVARGYSAVGASTLALLLAFPLETPAAKAGGVTGSAISGDSGDSGVGGGPPSLPPGFEGASHVPSDVAALAAIHVLDTADGFAFLDLLAGLYPELGHRMARLRMGLGLSAWNRAELSNHGIEPDAPLLLAWGRIDENEWREPGTPLMRHRLVVKTSDSGKAQAYVAEVVTRLGFQVATPGKRPPGWWTSVNRSGVGLAALAEDADSDMLVLVRQVGGFLLVDVAEPARPPLARPLWLKRLGRVATAMVAKDAPASTLAATFGNGSRRILGEEESSASIVLLPDGLAKFVPDRNCRAALHAATGAWFQDLALGARLHPFEWRVRLAAGLTEAARTGLGTTGSDEGLLDVRGLATSGLAAAALYLPSVAALRVSPRPRALSGGWAANRAAIDRCGGPAQLVSLVRYGPHWLDSFIDERAQALGIGKPAREAHNVAVAVQPAESVGAEHDVLILASFANTVADDLRAGLARAAGGPGQERAFGSRTPELYKLPATSSEVETCGLEPLPAGRMGLALGSNTSLAWYYRSRRRPSVFGNRSRLGAVYLNVGAFLQQQAQHSDEAIQSAVRLAGQQIGLMGGDLTVDDGGLLRLSLDLGAEP